MSLIGTAIGALVALVPAALHPKGDRVKELEAREQRLALKVADLSERFAALTRTREQLVNHIALIERQLDAERALANHWRGEAQRFARQLREQREQQQNPLPVPTWAEMQLYNQLYAQCNQQLYAQCNQQLGAPDFGWQGLCNCVPSRAQVWGAHGGLVQQLNDRGE